MNTQTQITTGNVSHSTVRNSPVEADRARLFERVILPHEQSLFGPAMALTRSSSDAEDLVQETLLRAFDRFETFRQDGSPRAWLHTIMRNLFFNMYRKKSREPKQVSLDVFEPTTTGGSGGVAIEADSAEQASQTVTSPERIVLGQMESAALLAAVKALPDEYRLVVTMADVQNMPYQDIADTLRIPIGTVRSRLSRGRERVRRAIFAWRPSPNMSQLEKHPETKPAMTFAPHRTAVTA
ncbi:MAG: sigma-70 family RNA polymerase sigma factor [Akkermansiaceae bacterium]|nr:sigma-70 family RNA polymerase sigma factor [Armatimonadota bacterium]